MPQSIRIEGNKVHCAGMTLSFPAVRMKLGERIYEPVGQGEYLSPLERVYRTGDFVFYVRVDALPTGGIRKCLKITCTGTHPTPAWVETDRQTIADETISRRGYMCTQESSHGGGDEEGSGVGGMPGCGYPLIGERFFAGAEHPAAFAIIEEKTGGGTTYILRQHPVWSEENTLELAGTVACWSDNGERSFRDYLNSIRLPPLDTPCFSFCTFWSDPYRGEMFYETNEANYCSFIKAFQELGLRPDVFTLDAGWHNRQSIFEPAAGLNGEDGMKRLQATCRRGGSQLGLWVSHNGPMGIDAKYLQEQGYAVGQGSGSAYGGDADFGVLLDKKLEHALAERLEAYVRRGIVQFKMDWDNECATNPQYSECYPTQAHVREASLNAMIRIVRRLRAINPRLILRNGWWPSPWWLMYVNHIFLSDSNDSEYTVLPSRTQRDSAATYRDTIYYCSLVRDKSAIPLDAFDNHEVAHALRNPFHEEPGTFADIMMLAVMRGTSYFPFTLQPEALDVWQAEILARIMDFARAYGKELYRSESSMFGGNPNAGDIYGFRYELPQGEAWCMLRNPSPMPQRFQWRDEMRNGVWVYPFYARYTAQSEIVFAPHEVKVIRLSRHHLVLPFNQPFQVKEVSENCVCEFYFPAQCSQGKVTPAVKELYRIDGLQFREKSFKKLEDGVEIMFCLRLPYRMRNTTINVCLHKNSNERPCLEARSSRSANDDFSCCQLPVTEYMAGLPGIGEAKNPDCVQKIADAFFSVPAQEGGEAWYSLFIHGISDWKQVELSVSGFYGLSRHSIKKIWRPTWLAMGLVPNHHLGFPMAQFLDILSPQK